MTTRTENGLPYAQVFNAENRLVSVTWPGHSVTFVYDGDGGRLLKTEDGLTTLYIGDYFEKTGADVVKYYYFGAEHAAMRNANGYKRYYFSDHLGTASVLALRRCAG